MSQITVTPEMIDTIAQIQRDSIFDEGFVEDITTLIDEYLLGDSAEEDKPEGWLKRIQLVRDLRYYQSTILRLFPLETSGK